MSSDMATSNLAVLAHLAVVRPDTEMATSKWQFKQLNILSIHELHEVSRSTKIQKKHDHCRRLGYISAWLYIGHTKHLCVCEV